MTERSRKAYYLEEDAYNILYKMSLRTGKDMSTLVNDAIRMTYSKVSSLSEEESRKLEHLANSIISLFSTNHL